MNNSKTPKIVVGVALGAVYATGLAVILARSANDSVVAANASIPPATEVAPDPFGPAEVIDPASGFESTAAVPDASEPQSAAIPMAAIAAPPPAREAREVEAATSVVEGRSQVETDRPVIVEGSPDPVEDELLSAPETGTSSRSDTSWEEGADVGAPSSVEDE